MSEKDVKKTADHKNRRHKVTETTIGGRQRTPRARHTLTQAQKSATMNRGCAPGEAALWVADSYEKSYAFDDS